MSVDVPVYEIDVWVDEWTQVVQDARGRVEWGVEYPTGKVVSSIDATREDVEPHATFPRKLVRRFVTEWETP